MKRGKLIIAAGLTASVALFASPLFAQAPGGTMSSNPTLQSAPATGQPGTQAPASAAPLGAASSDAMANGGASAATTSMPSPKHTRSEEEVRGLEVKTGRDITAAQAQGKDVAKAQRERWLGSTALSKGDRRMASEHFRRAEKELRTAPMASSNTKANRTDSNAMTTDRNPNASNMNPNRGSHMAY